MFCRAALVRLFGHVDCKELADRPMKLPVAEVVRRFADLPPNASRAELELLFEQCFYKDFIDIRNWVPLDLPKSMAQFSFWCQPGGEVADPVICRVVDFSFAPAQIARNISLTSTGSVFDKIADDLRHGANLHSTVPSHQRCESWVASQKPPAG